MSVPQEPRSLPLMVAAAVSPMLRRPPMVQAAALCLRDGKNGCEVLLISSLDSGRWILPKGWPMAGRTLAEAALREAWEEAGVSGKVEDTPVGVFNYTKCLRGNLRLSCDVTVFPVQVEALANDYPEAGRRRRKWVPPQRAAQMVGEPELRIILLSL
ncbi:NUDIX hydrolase [Rhodovulum imhoffii]|uniref:NUDIX hydrolase n=1 Tax=Rhodovulum imhoffii TaxID=365340 RepID=UPI001F5CABE2|nr:NUDIX hydrolase [Rhodovulum imhoffii]